MFDALYREQQTGRGDRGLERERGGEGIGYGVPNPQQGNKSKAGQERKGGAREATRTTSSIVG